MWPIFMFSGEKLCQMNFLTPAMIWWKISVFTTTAAWNVVKLLVLWDLRVWLPEDPEWRKKRDSVEITEWCYIKILWAKGIHQMSWNRDLPLVQLISGCSSQTYLINFLKSLINDVVEMVQKKILHYPPLFSGIISGPSGHWFWMSSKRRGVFIKLCQHAKDRKGYSLLSSE